MKETEDLIKIDGDTYTILFTEEMIAERIKQLAAMIKADYATAEQPPILLIVLTGGMMFGKDLATELDRIGLVNNIDTIGLKRYGDKLQGGAVEVLSEPHANLGGRDIIVVEDVVDHGATMNFLDNYLKEKNPLTPPKSIAYCVLGLKSSHGPLQFDIKYLGFNKLSKAWILGYGLDYKQAFRGFKNIWVKIDP